MQYPIITSRNNSEIKQTAKLHQRKYRQREGAYLLEGTKLLKEALTSQVPIEKIYATRSWLEREGEEFSDLLENIPVQPITEAVFSLLTQMKTPEGVAAKILSEGAQDFHEFFNQPLKVSLSYVILEDVQDPGNLGTIIRTADAAGYDAVFLSHACADPYSDKVLRASMGSVYHLPILSFHDLTDLIHVLEKESFEIIGSSLAGTDLDLHQAKRKNRMALILGNESRGMSYAAQQACTRLVKIPIYGQAESLNVAVAAGILLYAFIQK